MQTQYRTDAEASAKMHSDDRRERIYEEFRAFNRLGADDKALVVKMSKRNITVIDRLAVERMLTEYRAALVKGLTT